MFSFKTPLPAYQPMQAPQTADMSRMGMTNEAFLNSPAPGPRSVDPASIRTMAQATMPAQQQRGPGFFSTLDQYLNPGSTWADARNAVANRPAQQERSSMMHQLQMAVAQGMPKDQALAMLQDPASWSQAMNKNFEPRTAAEGSTIFGFGNAMGAAPKFGVRSEDGVGYAAGPSGVTATGSIGPQGMTVDQMNDNSLNDRIEASQAMERQARAKNLGMTGLASLINARKPGYGVGGGYGGPMGPPRARHTY